ncbi:magnesium-translocating P-type ATPase [Rhodocyclus gracilis]|uniref:Magnesium-transporting ATPase, P-type 1 n=1 Tax=Rhodocyclus tenuis TaxID=1066 RepID=A0A6L5JV78_RHOTE|nr:magnesium-translocating P-type ATPase [Rhodocyclus gracilis]MQY51139.1 magnesium-translocating P-type ATPase [Rhodocyclus gracilis]
MARFLKRRRALRHCGRPRLADSLARRGPAQAPSEGLGRDLLRVAREDPAALLVRLDSRAVGLTAHEAARRLARGGPNEVEHEAPLPWWRHVWRCYRNPFNLLLTVLAVLSYLSADAKATVVIGAMVVLSTLLRFVQEGRSHRAADSLKAMVSTTATVLRPPTTVTPAPAGVPDDGSGRQEIPLRRLVPGDWVVLSAGDMIPADCRVMTARDLFVAQAAMTGESLPVEKFVSALAPGGGEAGAVSASSADDPLAQRNLLFMGTNVVSGAATAIVFATGARTYFGALAALPVDDPAPTAFQIGVNGVSWLLIRFALVMVPIVFLLVGATKGNWSEAFLFALSVAVGLTPEMLPMIVTTTLAKGAVLLARQKVVVKRLDAIQNFGAMDVLCTDKTGTLTQDRIAVARHVDIYGETARAVLEVAFLNSFYQTGLKNLLDRAVLEHVELPTTLKLKDAYRKIDEIPFDFVRRRMSVVVAVMVDGKDVHHELICKGAVEEVLAACTHVRAGALAGALGGKGVAEPPENTALAPPTAASPNSEAAPQELALDAALRARVHAVTQQFNDEGLRVVALAVKTLPPAQTAYSVADETALALLGFIAFLDPPKESAMPALKALAAHGINVKVLSGDDERVTAHVCRQVGLPADKVLLGTQLDAMDEAALAKAVEAYRLFARLTPLHKERIVHALRRGGHVVGFMGDGINDAPALRAADIGISVDSAVDIAKEAADIILLEKSLMVLDTGVVEGRTTFCNMLKYIRMTASSNFGNVLSVLVASAFLPFLPMLPLQLLAQNLLYDISQTGIPFDRVDAELVAQPLQWNPRDIGRFMVFFGPISSLFDLLTFAVMWWVFSANTLAEQRLFQSGWFVVGLLTQTLVVHMLRTPKLPFIESRAAAPLTAMTLAIMAIGLWLPMGALAPYFKLETLPPLYFVWLLGILAGYAVLTTLMKRVYLRRFGWQ